MVAAIDRRPRVALPLSLVVLSGCFEIDPSYGETTTTADAESSTSTGLDPDADDDLDGIPNASDNCPTMANADQADADADTVGDACDVCLAAGFDDDHADYDGDGIPCAEDPCPFDGPTPTAPADPFGPVAEIIVSNADVAGTGQAFAVVSPGQAFTVTHDATIASCGCEGCIVQGYTGVVGNPSAACWYSGVPACVPVSGSASTPLTAPDEPGVYWLAVQRTLQFECLPEVGLPFDNVFGAFCVAP